MTRMKNRKHHLEPTEKECILQRISSYLSSEHKEIVVAYLFGSFVTEEYFGDIDIGIITKKDLRRSLVFELELENKVEQVAGHPVDVRILNKAPLSFCQSVIRYGRVIIEHDPNLRADFESIVLKQYFDFSPFRQQYLNEVINAPV